MLKTVYLIDDDQITLYLTKVIFELFSPQSKCICFETAQKAQNQLQADEVNGCLPDLILLDLNMPVMNGFELLKGLDSMAASFHAQGCYIFVLTSSVSEEDRDNSLKSPLVVDLIQKPFSQGKLDEILEALVNLKLSLSKPLHE